MLQMRLTVDKGTIMNDILIFCVWIHGAGEGNLVLEGHPSLCIRIIYQNEKNNIFTVYMFIL